VRTTRWRPAASSLRDAFVAAAIVWATLLVAAPYLASRTHASTSSSALVVAVYSVGSLVCHQLRARSYQLWTVQMAVCARCTGIYCGAVLGAVAARLLATRRPSMRAVDDDSSPAQPAVGSIPSGDRRPAGASTLARSLQHARVILGAAVLPTALTLAYEWSTGDMPSHAIRAAAGLPIGLAVAWLVVAAAENQVN
jgi:hypothetical protein